MAKKTSKSAEETSVKEMKIEINALAEKNKETEEQKNIKTKEQKTEKKEKEEKTEQAKQTKKQEKWVQKTRAQKKSHQRSKRYIGISGIIDKNKTYQIEEAIDLAKKTATIKFSGSIEVHIRLGIDISKSDQMVRGAIVLPHGTGKSLKVGAMVNEAKENEAKEAGADIIGGQELIDKIKQTGKIDFEVAVATPDMMPKLAQIAKILGPKGLMPSPKNETITTNLKKTIGELKKGKANFKNDDSGNLHNIIGKTSFETKQLVENFNALMDAIKKAKPASAKGVFIKNISINATMGPGIRVAV